MSRPVIAVENLSKSYSLIHEGKAFPSFRETVMDVLRSPWRRRKHGEKTEKDETFWALRDVSFQIERGEVAGIIGRNGAGKSTLLKILSRITDPTEGQIRMRGRVASLLEVGTGFHPELTGRENIYMNGSILGMKKVEIDRNFDAIVAFAEIEKFLDTPVKHYSSGMFIRLAFAVAAHLEPEILIVDEILAVGDAVFQKKCLGKMGEATKQGRTVLFVSHNMAVVRSLCHTCCIMEGGRLTMRGDVNECVDRYMEHVSSAKMVPKAEFSPPRPDVAWMRSASILVDGIATGTIPMGSSIRLVVEFASPTPMSYPRLGFVITNEEGQRVLNANNRYQQDDVLEFPTMEGTVSCDLGMVPLMPGRYTISLLFGDYCFDSHRVENALEFEVAERDVWGHGRIPLKSTSMLWWPTRFEFDSNREENVRIRNGRIQ